MRFYLILTGLIFLFSPDILLFDLLPDAIGWSFIVFGITPLADIEIRANEAKALAKRMLLFSAVKLVFTLILLGSKRIDILLLSFSYAIIELITVLPFCEKLTKSLDYTSMRLGSPLNSDKLNIAKWYLYVFFVLKNIFAVLPSVPSLFSYESTGNYTASSWYIDFDALMNVFSVLAFFLSIALSVVMLAYFIPFWTKISKNRELMERLREHRRINVLEKPNRMLQKNISFAFAFFAPATVFMFDFYLDFTDIFPTFIGFALIFIGAVHIARSMHRQCNALIVTSVLGFIVSLMTFLYRVVPLAENKFVMDYAFSSKTLTPILAGLTSLSVILEFVFLFGMADKFSKEYTKDKIPFGRVLYIIGGAVLAFFGFVLYVYPEKNTTFVFPSLIFGTAFAALSALAFVRLGQQIMHDNKD